MSSQDFVKLALQMTTMLGFAVLFGEIMRRFKQPAVVGEMFGGIILGPTILGWLAPSFYESLLLSSANVSVVREASQRADRRADHERHRRGRPGQLDALRDHPERHRAVERSAAEALGIHAFPGAFLLGVALGDADDGQKEAHDVIGQFVMGLAPIYFISMGMTTNFIRTSIPSWSSSFSSPPVSASSGRC